MFSSAAVALMMAMRMTRVTKSPDGSGICYCGSTCGGPVYMASLCITRTGSEAHRRVGIKKKIVRPIERSSINTCNGRVDQGLVRVIGVVQISIQTFRDKAAPNT